MKTKNQRIICLFLSMSFVCVTLVSCRLISGYPIVINLNLENRSSHYMMVADFHQGKTLLLSPNAKGELKKSSGVIIIYTPFNNRKLFYDFGSIMWDCFFVIREDGVITPDEKYYKDNADMAIKSDIDIHSEFVPVRYIGAIPKGITWYMLDEPFSTAAYDPMGIEHESFLKIKYPYLPVQDKNNLVNSEKVSIYEKKQDALLQHLYEKIERCEKENKKYVP